MPMTEQASQNSTKTLNFNFNSSWRLPIYTFKCRFSTRLEKKTKGNEPASQGAALL